jgi:hypothetical protein
LTLIKPRSPLPCDYFFMSYQERSRRRGWMHALVILALLTACAPASEAPPPPRAAASVPPHAPPRSGLTDAQVSAAADQLRSALVREVRPHITGTPESDRAWIVLARNEIAATVTRIDYPQLIVVVDRNPRVQALRIIVAQPDGRPWYVIGGSKVSTGQAGRFDYYITPTGVFPHTTAILDYRALGTFNENHIRGLGLKGMRVWDFGWQNARKGWLPDRPWGEIRLLLHATDPDYLEQRLGRPASQGCIRIPASMNRFLDLHGVLDADYERAAADDPRIAAILLPQRQPSRLAGNLLVVVDSSH